MRERIARIFRTPPRRHEERWNGLVAPARAAARSRRLGQPRARRAAATPREPAAARAEAARPRRRRVAPLALPPRVATGRLRRLARLDPRAMRRRDRRAARPLARVGREAR